MGFPRPFLTTLIPAEKALIVISPLNAFLSGVFSHLLLILGRNLTGFFS